MTWTVAVLVVTSLLAPHAHGQPQLADPEFERLLGAETLRCVFDPGVSATWDEEGVSSVKQGVDLGTLIFDSIDVVGRTARLIGNAGAEDVGVMTTPVGITLLERTPSGSLNFTTVFATAPDGNP